MNRPIISVVMPVYNGSKVLASSIESILSQKGVLFEFIIINDGSTDESEEIINLYMAKDSRIKVINQSNQGITKALINGCRAAKGEYIARQDVGDISLPGRLKAQLEAMRSNSRLVLISTSTRFTTPKGELLYTNDQSPDQLQAGLMLSDDQSLNGPPHHGSTMFLRAAYNNVGGYRAQFEVAQDLDLWTRLIEVGDVTTLEHVYYEATLEANSISAQKRDQQVATTEIIKSCIVARASGLSDSAALEQLSNLKRTQTDDQKSKPSALADYYYYLGSNLFDTNPEASLSYLVKSFKLKPARWKTILKILYLQAKKLL
ncbi:glycosyltransferase family 2 protein [Arenicella xantha]|uniref:Glycosyl transferase family 2 n=1 Tax=Arenicella xantha TaxID=644221 RepID=A0A395JJD9_9GAMM|nr:glycosyltransferase family 2 protein [Arenicella xantha]RBP49171.1 glycosyl transferase family 2 [Arenicella xantha]